MQKDTEGKVNKYKCVNGHITYTYDYDEGLTPAIIKCHCGKDSFSYFYKVYELIEGINVIWHKPCKEEYANLATRMKKYVDNRGLIRLNLDKPATIEEIEEYRNYAIVNFNPKLKLPKECKHPICKLEHRKLLDNYNSESDNDNTIK